MLVTNALILFQITKRKEDLKRKPKICKCTKNMGIGGGVSDPVSLDYEWVVTGDASTPIFCKFSLFSWAFCQAFLFSDVFLTGISSHRFPWNNVNDPAWELWKFRDGWLVFFIKCAPPNCLFGLWMGRHVTGDAPTPIVCKFSLFSCF